MGPHDAQHGQSHGRNGLLQDDYGISKRNMPQIIYKDITISILLDLLKVMMFGIFPLGNHFF